MTLEIWLLFTATATLNIISPGPAILLAISNGVSLGLRAVIASALGNLMGLFILSTISMFGLGVLLKTSALFFTALKVLGASYLIYLGVKKFMSTETFSVDDTIQQKPKDTQYFKKFKEAFFVAVTNPKAILFFVAFFPLFLDVNAPQLPQFIVMTFTFMGISFISLVGYGYLGKSARHWFDNTNMVKIFHRVTGGIFIGFGVALLQVKS